MQKTIPFSVQSFLDVRLYLQEVYGFRKSREEKFSYETWAQELGVSSKSYLRFAILGKRKISPDLTLKFCANLDLSKVDREYFTLLVLYTQCEEPQQKRILGAKLTSSLKNQVVFENHEATDELMADPFVLILRNYLSFVDAPRTSQDLISIFGVTAEQLEKGLRSLESVGAIFFDGNSWIAKMGWVRVGASPGNVALANYHNQSLLKAIAAQSLEPSQRSYRALSFALSEKEYNEILTELNDFAARVCADYDSVSIHDRRIYQLNFNLIPWTEKVFVTKDLNQRELELAP